MEIRKLVKSDNEQLKALIKDVEAHLQDETFWLPISDKSREHFFDENWTYFLGAFDGNNLIAAVGLFFNENEFGESREAIGITSSNLAEYGRAMVHSEHRNQGIMKQISKNLLRYAEEIGIKNIIATVHPKNIPSREIIKDLGFDKKSMIVKYNRYERDIFLLEL